MTAHVRDLKIEQGASFFLDAQVSIPLTGWTGQGQIRLTARDKLILASFTVTITDAEKGKFRISLTAEQTKLLTFMNGVYDLFLSNPDGLAIKVLEGKVTLALRVTR